MKHSNGMNFKRFLLMGALALGVVQAEEAPDPRLILEGARLSATLTRLEQGLTGQLRHSGSKTPVTLFLKGENIQFQFSEKQGPWQIFHMNLGDEQCRLYEIIQGKTRFLDANKLVSPIAGTDLTYEDLAMGFFYWPQPKWLGTESIKGQDCHKIRIEKPAKAGGRYQAVEVWVHTKYGAFMRVRGYDGQGGLLKEFQVENVMKVNDQIWTLKEMQVSTHDPKTGRRLSITDLTFDSPNKPKLQGLR
ncbi:MAG TPA: outer membrane lipoprotein-sorting protein [Luteolibacter sp.]|nr:outer membrane lipoprotein-sorting protein [Luteolibacter sp.]